MNLPFKGGVFVPHADLVLPGLDTGPLGSITVSSPWPALVPSGFQVVFQH